MYWLFDRGYPVDTIVCNERTGYGITFNGNDGDYCQKVLGGIKYNDQPRVYTLPY